MARPNVLSGFMLWITMAIHARMSAASRPLLSRCRGFAALGSWRRLGFFAVARRKFEPGFARVVDDEVSLERPPGFRRNKFLQEISLAGGQQFLDLRRVDRLLEDHLAALEFA